MGLKRNTQSTNDQLNAWGFPHIKSVEIGSGKNKIPDILLCTEHNQQFKMVFDNISKKKECMACEIFKTEKNLGLKFNGNFKPDEGLQTRHKFEWTCVECDATIEESIRPNGALKNFALHQPRCEHLLKKLRENHPEYAEQAKAYRQTEAGKEKKKEYNKKYSDEITEEQKERKRKQDRERKARNRQDPEKKEKEMMAKRKFFSVIITNFNEETKQKIIDTYLTDKVTLTMIHIKQLPKEQKDEFEQVITGLGCSIDII